jgi:hypothetical protein
MNFVKVQTETFVVNMVSAEMELQGPTLDDLFKKTRAKPHIYYLPLTEKDVAEKLAARRQASMIKPSVKA